MDVIYETPRLRVRTWTERDVDFLFDMYSRWEVQRFLGKNPQVMHSRDQAVATAQRLSAYTPDELFGAWAITDRAEGTPYGTVLLKQLPLSNGVVSDADIADTADTADTADIEDVEVGWHLHPAAWGHGYATESARGALARGFDAGLAEVFAVVRPENLASQAVCRRLGMAALGSTDRYYDLTVALFVAAPDHTARL